MSQVWHRPAAGVALAYAFTPVQPGAYVNVPDGRCGLVFADNEVWWLGPATRPWIAERALDGVVGIRLHHLSGREFAQTSLDRWRDARVKLEQLPQHASDCVRLEETLQTDRSPQRQAATLAAYASLHAFSAGTDRLKGAAEMLSAATANETVAGMAARLGISTRHLHRRCLDIFGMPPTLLRRIARLHRTASAWVSDPDVTMAELAAEAGFSDQAHLVREMRALALSAPSQALAHSGRGVSDSFKTTRRLDT